MNKRIMFLGVLVTAVLGLSALSWALAQEAGSVEAEAAANGDSSPSGPPEVVIPEQYRPPAGGETAVTQVATVYFTPQDTDASTTVIFLYNTSNSGGTVYLTTYELDGNIFVDTSVWVPAHHLVRICADPVSTYDSSWQSAVLINLRTWSTYARMQMPSGIHAEAYVAWNNGTYYDPLAVVPSLPIRFSTDLAKVLLPLIQRNHP